MEVEPVLAAASSPPSDDDFVMVEAGEVQSVVDSLTPAVEPPSAQAQAEEDDEMMEEIKQEKTEIKLEDLFDGMDSDDDELLDEKKPG
jgi:DNA primase small subunit